MDDSGSEKKKKNIELKIVLALFRRQYVDDFF